MHQYLLSRDDLFNETCMEGVDTIHIAIWYPSDFYFPYFVALLRKVNALRKVRRTEPLKLNIFVIFDDHSGVNDHYRKQIAPFARFFDKKLDNNLSIAPFMDNSFSVKEKSQNKVVSFHIFDDFHRSDVDISKCHDFSGPNIYHYRLSTMLFLNGFMENVKMKVFETPDDIVEMMNHDICGKRYN